MPRQATPHIRTTVGANIARLRTARGLTQLELANTLGMDPMGVSRWERGKVMPRPEALTALADVLADGDLAALLIAEEQAA